MNTNTEKLNMTTQDLIKRLRNLGPLGKIMEELVIVAADRLEELQFLVERKEIHSKDWEDQAREARKKRDEARAEVETLKQALHDARLENSGQAAQLERPRPEPSRLEIAAMLKAGWFANRDADFNATDQGWWVEQADKLIAAAREAK